MRQNSSWRAEGDAVLPRLAAEALRRAMEVSPVVVLMGARQTGKSTLVQTLPSLQEHSYLTLDEIDLREQAGRSPDDLIHRAPKLIIDEVQREADLILVIKRTVDEQRPRRTGQFILTGSANLLLMQRISDTLAGRSSYVTLWPLTRRERLGLGQAGIWDAFFEQPPAKWLDLVHAEETPQANWTEAARRGGYPTPAHMLDSPDARDVWFAGYMRTYLERDLQDLSSIENLIDFRRLMRATCLRLGNLVNQTELGRDTGLSQPTVHRYLNLLETSFQLVRLEPYAVNRTKRLIKTPKAYWSDTGLALALSNEAEPRGAHLENLVLADLVVWREAHMARPQILYWRTASGQEVDFVIEFQDQLLPVEVKASTRPSPRDAAHVKVFLDEYPDRARGGLLLHGGTETFWAAKSVLAAPWWRVM